MNAKNKISFLVPCVYYENYRNGSFIHGINISRMTILVNIRNFIFMNPLASYSI